MSADDHLNQHQFFHGSGKRYRPGDELTDQHGSGLWLSESHKAASYYGRQNAMGRREYFGDAEASPHVYHVEPLEGLQHRDTGYQAARARVVGEVGVDPMNFTESWDTYAKRTPPSVL